jgi:integrase/recombinase XerC/integrase/recombinase XerD
VSTIDDFLSGYGTGTARTYGRTLHEAARIMRQPVELADGAAIARYRRALDGQAPATLARKLATLAALYEWLNVTGARIDNPMAGVRRPKVDRLGSIKYLSADECLRLLEACTDARELALTWVLLHGLRVGEVVSLDVPDLRGDTLTFTGKGSKVRSVVLEPDGVAALIGYIGRRRSGPLFTGRKGRLQARAIERMVASLAQRALGEHAWPHMLRHSFATQLVKSGTNIVTLSRMLGHASAATTQIYVRTDESDLRAVVRRSPLATRAAEQRFTILGGEGEVAEAQ